MSTIFSKLISGEIPSFKIYEDEYTFAFLDIFPQQMGHTLIVPKIEIDHFADVPEPYYSAIFKTAKKLAPAIKQATNCTRVCTMMIGYEIPHCHYHMIPTQQLSDVVFSPKPQADMEELKRIQEKIIQNITL
jgi:histidine triad (HIT) family protein